MTGFFSGMNLSQASPHTSTLPLCGACGLYEQCVSPKIAATGQGQRGILFVSDMPSENDDKKGEHLTEKSNTAFYAQLAKAGVHARKDCWSTGALICRSNKSPTEKQIGYCIPNLMSTISELQPKVIILSGDIAAKALLRQIWKSDVGSLQRWVGFQIPDQKLNAWVCPIDSYSSIHEKDKARKNKLDQHIQAAMQLTTRPFKKIPDYKKKITVIHDPNEAAKIIYKMRDYDGMAAFDFETNMLKPEGNGAEIVSCSICWGGKRTIAYPWYGAVIKATRKFLRSPIPKIASNLKFEERWSRKILKTPVRNWHWDTMIYAHVKDSRPGITSIKFQAFILLGQGAYDNHIKPYFQSPTSMTKNKIDQVNLHDLLLYNGLDSLLEYKVAELQMEELDAKR